MSDPREVLTGLRQLLAALKSKSMTINQDGKDVTQRELDKLKPDIEYLESVHALAGTHPKPRSTPKGASKASELAAQKIDELSDPSATDEERQTRKRRLLKGPKEFRDIRRRSS
jgi:hypothetical protein